MYTSNWMKRLWELSEKNTTAQNKLRIGDLVLPGTHNSGSYSIPNPLGGLAKCQNLSILEQLHAGIRYLDLRVAEHEDHLYVFHSILKGSLFQHIVYQIKEFVEAYPTEFVVLDVQPEYGQNLSTHGKQALIDMLQTIPNRVHPSHIPQLLNSWTIKDAMNAQENVWIVIHERFLDAYFTADKLWSQGFAVRNRYLRSKWFDTRNIDKLLVGILQEVKMYGDERPWTKGQRQRNESPRLLVNQCILTPGIGWNAIVNLQPRELAKRLNSVFAPWMVQHSNERWHVVMMDFVQDYVPLFPLFLIALNCPSADSNAFGMCLAVYSFQNEVLDVTNALQSHICREVLLFVPDLSEILPQCKRKKGSLTLAYSIDGEYWMAKVDLAKDRSVLLSSFYSNIETTKLENDFTSGFIVANTIYQDLNEMDSETESPILAFERNKSGKISFQLIYGDEK